MVWSLNTGLPRPTPIPPQKTVLIHRCLNESEWTRVFSAETSGKSMIYDLNMSACVYVCGRHIQWPLSLCHRLCLFHHVPMLNPYVYVCVFMCVPHIYSHCLFSIIGKVHPEIKLYFLPVCSKTRKRRYFKECWGEKQAFTSIIGTKT